MNDIRRGDIFYVTRNYQEEGSEQHAGRPAIIVSNDINNANSTTVEVVYLTTQPKATLPTHCTITSTNRTSTALCEQVSTIHVDRLDSFIATATLEEMQAIDKCLLVSLGIGVSPVPATYNEPEDYVALKAERDMLQKHYDDLVKRLVAGTR